MEIPLTTRQTRVRNPVRYVYFIQAATLGLIKIGLTNDVAARMRSLGTDSPDRLSLLGVIASSEADAIEARLHFTFRAHRSHGEWFRASDDLLRLIERFGSSLEQATIQRICSIFPETRSAAEMAAADAALERFLAAT